MNIALTILSSSLALVVAMQFSMAAAMIHDDLIVKLILIAVAVFQAAMGLTWFYLGTRQE